MSWLSVLSSSPATHTRSATWIAFISTLQPAASIAGPSLRRRASLSLLRTTDRLIDSHFSFLSALGSLSFAAFSGASSGDFVSRIRSRVRAPLLQRLPIHSI